MSIKQVTKLVDTNTAITACRYLEPAASALGYHVGLTGGTLYKDGNRKDVDIILYPHDITVENKTPLQVVTILKGKGLFVPVAGRDKDWECSTTDKEIFVGRIPLESGDIRADLFFLS